MRKGICVTVIAAVCGATALAQQTAPAAGPILQLRAQTRVVAVDVIARGRDGQPVKDLGKSDFSLAVDGYPRAFPIFSVNTGTAAEPAAGTAIPAGPGRTYSNRGAVPETESRHSALILIDAVNGWWENFNNARQAVAGALARIPPDERIAVYMIDRYKGLELLADYTTDRAHLRQAIRHYTPGGICPAPPGEESPGDNVKFTANTGTPPPQPASPSAYAEASTSDSPCQSASRAGEVTQANGTCGTPAGADAASDAEARAYEEAFAHSACEGAGRAGQAALRGAVDTARLALVALASILASLPGRKSVFWITEGFPPDMLQDTYICPCADEWKAAMEKLNAANVAVNTIDSNGAGGPPRLWGPGGVLSMQQVSAATGGQAFYNDADLPAALTRGIDATRGSYTLGFYLPELDGKYHSIQVSVDRPGVTLGYRRGYEAQSDRVPGAAMVDMAGETGVGITARVTDMARTEINLWMNLDPATLTVSGDHDAFTAGVDELLIERNGAGRELARISDTKDVQFNANGLAAVRREGLILNRSLTLAPGATELVIVVRDRASGRSGSLTLPLAPTAAVGDQQRK
jgi:VWFA-related protein